MAQVFADAPGGEVVELPRKLTAPEGKRNNFGATPGQQTIMAEWQSEDGQATDLEIIIAPDWGFSPQMVGSVSTSRWAVTMLFAGWGMKWEHGRGKTSSGQGYQTLFGVENATAAPGPAAHLRASGIRRRLVATHVQLWGWLRTTDPQDCADIVCSIAPTVGPIQVIPAFSVYAHLAAFPFFSTGPALIPMGAEECRLLSAFPLQTVEFLGADATTVTDTYVAGDLIDWTPINFQALLWRTNDLTGRQFQMEFR